MKAEDRKTTQNMVSRSENRPNSTFHIHKAEPVPAQDGTDAEHLAQELVAEQAEFDAVEQGIAERKKQLLEKQARVAEALRQEKLDTRASLLDDAADWREIARTSPDADRAKDFLRKAKNAEADATRLGAELNLNDPIPTPQALSLPSRMISTNKAIQLILALFLGFVLITWIFGRPMAQDPMNAIGQSMMANAPIRALLSFTLTFLTFLVAVFFIRVAFPQFYRLWHNRIDSERSLDSLINEAPAWAVLLALLGLFYTFMQLFASFYQALYA